MALQRALGGFISHKYSSRTDRPSLHPALTPVCPNSLVSFLWLHEFLSAEWQSLDRMDREHPHPNHWPESSPGRLDMSSGSPGAEEEAEPCPALHRDQQPWVPCLSHVMDFPGLSWLWMFSLLLSQPSQTASAFSVSLPGPFWPLRADIPGVPSEFLLAVLFIAPQWKKEKEGAKQAFPLKLLCFKC